MKPNLHELPTMPVVPFEGVSLKGGTVKSDDLGDLIAHLSGSNRRLIEQVAQQLIAAQGETLTPEPLDYKSYIGVWLSHLHREGKSPDTISTYQVCIRKLLEQFPQPQKVHLETYLALKATYVNPTYLNVQIAAMRSFFGCLIELGMIRDDPSSKLRRVPIPRRRRGVPRPEHIAQLLRCPMSERDRAMLLLMVDCGLRVGELSTIRLRDLDLDQSELAVIGKGDKERVVPMSKPTVGAIRDYLAPRPLLAVYLFPKQDEDVPVNKRVVEQRVEYLCQEAGVPRMTPHQFRHFFASAMLSRGANLRVVAELLGHASTSTTANVYWHEIYEKEKRQAHQNYNPLKGILDELDD
jgi:integrase/recombinase XerD